MPHTQSQSQTLVRSLTLLTFLAFIAGLPLAEAAKSKAKTAAKLAGGALAGIIVGILVFLIIIAVIIFFCVKRSHARKNKVHA